MFIGEYRHTLDEKNRLAIPAKFRSKLGKGAVITRGLDNCLFIYTKEEWAKLSEKLAALPLSRAQSRAFSRLMLAGAMDAVLDTQGRVLVPDYLKRFANLAKDTVIAGVMNRLEVWDEQAWIEYSRVSEQNSNEIAEQLSELGI